jgi:hypothetical protein
MPTLIPPCDCCGSPIRSIAAHDHEVTHGDPRIAGAFLCDRESCIARHNHLRADERARLYHRLPVASDARAVLVRVEGASPAQLERVQAAVQAALAEDDDIDGPALSDIEETAAARVTAVLARSAEDPMRRYTVACLRSLMGGSAVEALLATVAKRSQEAN